MNHDPEVRSSRILQRCIVYPMTDPLLMHYGSRIIAQKAVTLLSQSVTGLSLQTTRFHYRSGCLGCALGKVATGHILLQVVWYSHHCHVTNATYSLIYLLQMLDNISNWQYKSATWWCQINVTQPNVQLLCLSSNLSHTPVWSTKSEYLCVTVKVSREIPSPKHLASVLSEREQPASLHPVYL